MVQVCGRTAFWWGFGVFLWLCFVGFLVVCWVIFLEKAVFEVKRLGGGYHRFTRIGPDASEPPGMQQEASDRVQ